MLTIIEIRSIEVQTNNQTGQQTHYQQFLLKNPEAAGRFNITTWDATRRQNLENLKGQDCMIGLEQRKTESGALYWSVSKDPEPLTQYFKSLPLSDKNPSDKKGPLFGNQ